MHALRYCLLGAILATAFVLVNMTDTALADPVNGTHKAEFDVTCDGQTYQVVAGRGAAAQVVDSEAVLIPAAFVQVSSWTDPLTGQTVTQTDAFSVGQGDRTGQEGDQITCTYTANFQDPDVGPVTVNGLITGFFAPRM